MRKYEYNTIASSISGEAGYLRRNQQLDNAGKEGWELVTAYFANGAHVLILRKEIEDAASSAD